MSSTSIHPMPKIFGKKYWELTELENDIYFWFLVIGFFPMKISLAFVWSIIYFCTMDGFFRILKKISSKLICTRLYLWIALYDYYFYLQKSSENDLVTSLKVKNTSSKCHSAKSFYKVKCSESTQCGEIISKVLFTHR